LTLQNDRNLVIYALPKRPTAVERGQRLGGAQHGDEHDVHGVLRNMIYASS
jgi:hypothetical protein